MNWSLKLDTFSELYSILDGQGHLVCEHVGKGNAEMIVEAVNQAFRWTAFPSDAILALPNVESPFVYLDGEETGE